MEKVVCNLCGLEDESSIYDDKRLNVVICKKCSLVYLNPRMTTQEYKEHYNKNYQLKRHNLVESDQAVERLKSRDSYGHHKERYFGFIKDFIPNNSRVLEVGSGWGTLLKVIKDNTTSSVVGIEISDLASRVAREYYGLQIYNCTFEEYLPKSESNFNLIILNHVLEHFPDPLSVLRSVSSILDNGGKLFIAVPNIFTPDEPLDRYFRIEHCYYFSPLTLENMLDKAGFCMIKLDFNPSEMRIIAAKKESALEQIDTSNFQVLYSSKNIIKAVNKQRIKYNILRFFKKIIEAIFPKKMVDKLREFVVKLFKKLKIIEI